jgi:hypothetical protein
MPLSGVSYGVVSVDDIHRISKFPAVLVCGGAPVATSGCCGTCRPLAVSCVPWTRSGSLHRVAGGLRGFFVRVLLEVSRGFGANLVEPGRALGALRRSLVEALELYKSSHRKNLKGE